MTSFTKRNTPFFLTPTRCLHKDDYCILMAFTWGRDSAQFTESVLTERSMMMPFRDGDVDWITLGNILRSKLMGEVLLASYVDLKHCEKKVDFIVDTDWKYAYEEKDVVVLKKQNRANPNFFSYMGRGVVEATVEEIAEFLSRPEAPLFYDHHIVDSRHVDIVSQTEHSTNVIVYYRSEATRCLVKSVRDMVLLSSRATSGGKYMSASMSIDHPLYPPVDGVKRAQLQPGCGWLLEPYKGDKTRTLVSYSLHIDLIGMPPVVSNRVLKRQPLNIYYLRRHLVELRQNSHCASGFLPAGPQHQTREPMAESSPLDVANSGRHFEQPLPVSSFTTSNLEHFTTAELIRVEVERHSISSCLSQSENSVTCEDLEASKQDVQYNLQLVSDEEEEEEEKEEEEEEEREGEGEGEGEEERAVGGSDPEMASPI